MSIICADCGRDINALGQNNMSYSNSYALCEDCARVQESYSYDYPLDDYDCYVEDSE